MLAPDSLTVTEKMLSRLVFSQQVAHESVGLARGSAVADCDGADVVLRISFSRPCACSAVRSSKCERYMHVVCEKLSGLVHHRDLASGAQAGVDAQHGDGAGGRREQQILQIVAEDLDGIYVGSLLQFEANLALDGGVQQAFPSVFNGEFELRRPVAVGAQYARSEQADRAVRINLDEKIEDVFGLAAADGEHAVRGNRLHRLAIFVVHLELFLLVDGVDRACGWDDSLFKHQ